MQLKVKDRPEIIQLKWENNNNNMTSQKTLNQPAYDPKIIGLVTEQMTGFHFVALATLMPL